MNLIKTVAKVCTLPLVLAVSDIAYAQNFPFPQGYDHFGIKPELSQNDMNNSVASFYSHWKSNYLREADTGGYFVFGADTDGIGKGTSESHGYGMIITVLMAGHDDDAHTYYDGMWTFFDNHRSAINSELMGWRIEYNETGSGSHDSAADGDMDIAYSLLMAHKQWGSDGDIDYQQEAIDMINNGIRVSLLSDSSKRIMRGDWDADPLTTRSSDWMPAHLRAYHKATSDDAWNDAIVEIYAMVDEISNSYSSQTGLMPDFVTGDPAEPNVADSTGEQNSGDYFYNAARTPWRLATDYLHYGNTPAKNISNKVVNWARTIVGEDLNFHNYHSGYKLDGTSLGNEYSTTAFIAPLIVAAATDSNNQDFLNAGWSYISDSKETYFEDSINLLSMLMISGNWWSPDNNISPTPNPEPGTGPNNCPAP